MGNDERYRWASPLRHPPAWVGDVVAALVVIALGIAPYPSEEYRAGTPFAFTVTLLPAILLPFRRRWPIPILAGCIALYGVAAVAGTLAPGIVVASAIAIFNVATKMTRRTTLITASLAVVAVLALSLLAAMGAVFDPRALQFAVTVAFAAAAGDATRSRREYITAITERAERAEETRESEARRRVSEERLRIARDLHDSVAHQISVISLNAGVASSSLNGRPDVAREALATIRTASRAVLGEIGDLLLMLRADDDEPGASPQPGFRQVHDLLDRFRAAGLDVTFRRTGADAPLPLAVDTVAYRIIQEALTNAHKHGHPSRAHVLVDRGEEAVRIIITNPVDSRAATESLPGGYGLLGMSERVASVRGTIESAPVPAGYRVEANIPLPKGVSM